MNAENALGQAAGPAYRIVTPRLVIRCWDPADAPRMKEAIDASVDHLRPWMPWARDEPQPLQQKIDYLRGARGRFDLGQDFVYGIFDRQESRVLGGTGLHPRLGPEALEIGYWIHVDFTGQGLVTETAAALTRVAFEVDRVQRVEIHCDSANGRSAAVARRLGYVHVATLPQVNRQPDGRFLDAMIWMLLREDYPNSPGHEAKAEAFDAIGRRLM